MPTNYKVANGNIYKTFSEKCTFTRNVCGLRNARGAALAGGGGGVCGQQLLANAIKGPRLQRQRQRQHRLRLRLQLTTRTRTR